MFFFTNRFSHSQNWNVQSATNLRHVTLSLFLTVLLPTAFVACGGGGSSVQGPSPSLQPSAAPSASPQHVYFSDAGQPGTISVFTLPITVGSASVAQIAGNNGPMGMAFDGMHRLVVANRAAGFTGTGNVQIFTTPLSNGATPDFTLQTGSSVCIPTGCARSGAWDAAFDQAGDLFVAGKQPFVICPQSRCPQLVTGGMLIEFAAPVSGSSMPSFTFTFGVIAAGITVDHSDNLWVTLVDGSLFEFPPPYNQSNGLAVRANAVGGVAFDSQGRLYIAATDGIDVYLPPFSSSMTKAFTISVTTPQYLAFDLAGKLYVTTGTDVLVFAPPLSATSVPVTTFAPAGSAWGIAIGP